MEHVSRGLFVILGSVAISACGAPPESAEAGGEPSVGNASAALEADQTTSSQVGFVCSPSTAFYLFFDVTAPTTVEPSEAFPVTVHITNLLPPTVAPFAGTFSSSVELLATLAAPSSQSLSLGTFHFATGDILGNIGSAATTLTATDHVGAPIVLNAGAFDYTVTPESTDPQIVGHCVPPAGQPSLATIPVVRTPRTKDDCKDGGWRTHTDAAGNPFKNEGRCIDYVLH